MKYIYKVILVILAVMVSLTTPVAALTKSERSTYGKNNIYWYNPDGDCVRGEDGGYGYSGTISGEDNQTKIWNYFVSAGINGISNNPAAIAGILGNMNIETGGTYNPFIVSKSGTYHGLYQSNSTSMIQAVGSLGNYWGSTSVPTEINDKAIDIELDYLVNDKFASPEKRFQAYVNSALSNNISNSANGAEIYAELFMVAVERAYGGTGKLQSSEAKALAYNLNLQRYANGNWQGMDARRRKAAEIYNQYMSGSTSNSNSTINLDFTNNITYNTCRTGNNSPYTGIGIPQYFQCGESWSNLMYGDEGIKGSEGATICASGCGPTSFAMMATVLLGRNILPDETANIAGLKGQHVYGVGSSWTITKVLADYYGLQYKALNTCDISTINQYLNDGWMIHTSGAGRAPFTQGGHYIGITSVNSNGEWYIANSAGRNNANGYYSPTAVISAGMKCSNVKAIKR